MFKRLFPAVESPWQGVHSKPLMWFAGLLVAFQLLRVIGFVSINIPYAVLLPVMLLPVIMYGVARGASWMGLYVGYICYLVCNVIVCNPPAVFHSWGRLGLFTALLLAVAPVVQNVRLRYYRLTCLRYLLNVMTILSVISFIGYFVGINGNTSRWAESIDYSKAGAFAGMFWTSMILGPVAAISACYTLWLYLMTQNKLQLAAALICMGATLFSASRSAVYGGLLGCVVVMLSSNRFKTRAIRKLMMLVIACCVTLPLWQGAMSGISQKNEAGRNLGTYGSRTEKFECRIAEIESSPVFGVGFASIDIHGRDIYNPYSGIVEPGSSWLGVTSMTGVTGLIFMIAIFVKAFVAARRTRSVYGSLMTGLVCFFAFHLMFEGYVLAAGSLLSFIFWLLMGVSTDLAYSHTTRIHK